VQKTVCSFFVPGRPDGFSVADGQKEVKGHPKKERLRKINKTHIVYRIKDWYYKNDITLLEM
jgi:hypothetical protein